MNSIKPEKEHCLLASNEHKLRMSGFYFPKMNLEKVSTLLRQCKVGTFFIRDSEHSSNLYTLSVQTRNGPVNCFIRHSNGRFCLDSDEDIIPHFSSVPQLVEYYVHQSWEWSPYNSETLVPVWLEYGESNMTTNPMLIFKALYGQKRSLQHLCRVTIMKNIKEGCEIKYQNMEELSMQLARAFDEEPQFKTLPDIIKNYLVEYPYSQ